MESFVKKEGNIKISEDDFIELEEKYKIQFPKAFKDFYIKNNGLKIYLCIINEQYEVNTFLPLRGGFSIESVKDNENIDGFVPSNMIPFSYDRGGDMYYVNVADQAIYSIRCETIDRHVLMANSFEDFIEILNKSDKR